MSRVGSFKELIVYQKAYRLAMEIFEISRSFLKEEKYSLIDQIRNSSSLAHQIWQKCELNGDMKYKLRNNKTIEYTIYRYLLLLEY